MRNIGVVWDSEVELEGSKPFNYDVLNETYSVLAERAVNFDFRIVISSFEQINGSTLEKGYTYTEGEWVLEKDVEIQAAIDKFRFESDTISQKRDLRNSVTTLNPMFVEETAYDKNKTVELFPDLTPATQPLSKRNLTQMLNDNERVVVKPNLAHGGKNVSVIESEEELDLERYGDALIQEFVDTTQGINGLDVGGVHDLRIVGVGRDPVFAYVRTNEEGFVSNVSQGGEIQMIDLEEVPEEALGIFDQVSREFGTGGFFFGVDLAFDEGENPFILEINSTPGLPWYGDKEVKKHKLEFWKRILKELDSML